MMKTPFRLLAAAFAALALAAPAHAAKDVVFAVASTFTTTDPYDANDTLSQAMAKSFYEGLFGFDRNMKLIPVLAESYEASKDGLTYTIKLKKGIKFHDGTDFNAEAVKANFDRVTNPDNKLKRYGLYSIIAKTEVVDPYTATITLKEPFSAFINDLAHPSGVMISPAALKQYGSKDIAFHPVGTGPFKFVEWKATDYLKVAKNESYWRKGYPKVDTITWKPVVDNNSRAALMQTGEAQFTFPVPYELADVLKAKPNLELVAAPSIVLRYLSMNTQQKPFDNPKVRQAIAYAINKQALAKVAFAGYAVPADGVVPDAVEYSVKLGPWPYDLAKAKKLMAEAGYPNGFETELWSAYNHSTAQKVSQFLQQQLRRSASGRRSRCSKRDSASRRSRAGRIRRPRRCACTTSAGRHRPARPTGRCALFSSAIHGRRSSSIPRITRATRSTRTSRARSRRATRRRRRSSIAMRSRPSGTMRPGRRS